MAFPGSPTTGDKHYTHSQTWEYSGSTWVQIYGDDDSDVLRINPDEPTGSEPSPYQPLSASLTTLSGVTWTAGTQVPTLTAASTVTMKTVGSATGNILDKAAGDALYQPVDATLTALAGVTTAADKLIYATAADTFTTATLTTFGRSLIDDAAASDARATLGLGTIATQPASAVDITGGNAVDLRLVRTTSTGSTNTASRFASAPVQYYSEADPTTGAIVFIATSSQLAVMYRIKIIGHVYDEGFIDLDISGYRTGGAGNWWYPYKINRGTIDVMVRFGLTGDGYNCVVLGDTTTTWSYPNVVMMAMLLGYTGATTAHAQGWTTALVTDLSAYTKLTEATDSTQYLTKSATVNSTSLLGYTTGAGGTVSQGSGSGKATAVTLNKACGTITMNNAALAADTSVSFTLTSSAIAATDVIAINHSSGGTFGAYVTDAQAGAGGATIVVRNVTAGSLSEAIVLRFAVIKAVTA